MKRASIAVLIIGGVALLAGGGYALFEAGARHAAAMAGQGATAASPPPAATSSAASTPATAAAASGERIDPKTGRRVLYWHDPMVPGQKFDKPGKSPFMNMELAPVFADETAGAGSIAIDPRLAQSLGIRTADVVRGSLDTPLEAVGAVAYNDRDSAVVQARASGWIEKLHVRAPLDPVRKGQVLAELYVPDWVAAQEEFLTVRRMKLGDPLVDGARQRMRLAGMSDEHIALVEAGAAVHPRMQIVAPIGGVVAELQAREGMTVMNGAMLFRLNGLSTVWVNAEVPEGVAASVRPGMQVEATTSALPGKVFRGRVGAVLPEVNAATRTLKARVELANAGGQLVPGMFANVKVLTPASSMKLLVPTEAVIRTGRRSIVMVAAGDGKFTPVDVETGIESGGRIEVRKGLTQGQKVVASGQFLVDSEASLKGVEARLQSTPEMPTPPAATPSPARPSPAGAAAPAVAPAAAPGASSPASPLAAAAPAKGVVHQASGRIDRVDGREAMISHGPVPSLKWPAMTMGFRLPSGSMPAGAKAGDAVQFEFRQAADGEYEIVSLRRATGASR